MIRFFILMLLITNLCYGQTGSFKSYTIEPETLSFEMISNTELRGATENELILEKYRIRSMVASVSVTSDGGANLYYRIGRDTDWIGIYIPYAQLKIDTANLDGKGEPELIVKGESCSYGSGGGSCYGAFMVLSLDTVPILLLKVTNHCAEDIYGNAYQGTTFVTHSYSRPVSRKKEMIIIPPVSKKDQDSWNNEDCELMSIPAGKYKLINGKFRKTEN